MFQCHFSEDQMAAYIVGTMQVTDTARYASYRAGVNDALQKYGGRFLVRGGDVEALEGPAFSKRMVVVEFASMEALRKFWDSPEYEALKQIRREASEAEIWAVQGA
jgi:uncharacterized protein (DUF1330 family)